MSFASISIIYYFNTIIDLKSENHDMAGQEINITGRTSCKSPLQFLKFSTERNFWSYT